MEHEAFEARPLYQEDIVIPVETFAKNFSDRDTTKLLHKHSREKMVISADLLLKMMETPKREEEKKLPVVPAVFLAAMAFGFIFALQVPEKTRLLVLVALLGGGILGLFLGYHGKPLVRKMYKQIIETAQKRLENIK